MCPGPGSSATTTGSATRPQEPAWCVPVFWISRRGDRGNVAAVYAQFGHVCRLVRKGDPPRPTGVPYGPLSPLPFPCREPSFSGQAATEQASGSVGAVKAGAATRSAAEGLALTAQARTTATLLPRLTGPGSRFLALAERSVLLSVATLTGLPTAAVMTHRARRGPRTRGHTSACLPMQACGPLARSFTAGIQTPGGKQEVESSARCAGMSIQSRAIPDETGIRIVEGGVR